MFHRSCLVVSKSLRTTGRLFITTKSSSTRTGTTTRGKSRIESRVLLDLSSTHYCHSRMETAVVTGIAGEVVGRAAAADFAIMRDSELNPKSIYNLGRIQQRKRDGSCYVSYTDKLFPSSQYSSFGLPVYGSAWFTRDTPTMYPYPSVDVAPSAVKSLELKLTGTDPKYKWRGVLVSDSELRHLRENLPIMYFLTMTPQLPEWVYVNVDERTSITELQQVIQTLWPTILTPNTIVITSPDMTIDDSTRIRHLRGKRFSVVVDGTTEFKFHGGEAWDAKQYDWNANAVSFWLKAIPALIVCIIAVGMLAPPPPKHKQKEGHRV